MNRKDILTIRYVRYLVLQILVLPIVIGLFRFLPDKKTASVFASVVFIAVCVICFAYEFKRVGFRSMPFWLSGLQFFLFFAIPIFSLRLVYWNHEFADIITWGFRIQALHSAANLSYMVWMAATAYEARSSFKRRQ